MIEIIPAIDIIGGKCVRLTEGDYSRVTSYADDPLAVAKSFADVGVRRLHLVDLDGAKAGAVMNHQVLEKIAGQTKLRIDFGGGIMSEEELKRVFESGAAYATIGSMAVKQPEIFQSWIAKFDAGRFFIGADVRNELIAIKGWTEQTQVSVIDFLLDQMSRRAHYFFCTDISKDGKLLGPALDLYRKIIARCPGIRLVASGGVSCMDDILRLEETGCEAVIVGKAIYENRISLAEIEKYNARSVSSC